MKFSLILVLFTLCPLQKADEPATLRIAVASNFITTARQLVAEYEPPTAQNIILSPGSTGKLTTQIRFGAPYDIFMSADRAHPQKLITQNLAVAESLQAYAIGQLALISRIDLGMPTDLAKVNRQLQIAIANPKIAPYGAAGERWLTQNVSGYQQHKIVMGENINQAWHYFINGGADIGLVAMSQIKLQQKPSFKFWLLTTDAEQLIQSAVILKDSEQMVAAQQFLEFLRSPEALKIIQAAGYKIPNN